jgi:hypothetical protein
LTVRAGEQSMRSSFDNFPDGRYEHPSDAAIVATLGDIAEQPGVPRFGRILHVEQRNMSHVTVAFKKDTSATGGLAVDFARFGENGQ